MARWISVLAAVAFISGGVSCSRTPETLHVAASSPAMLHGWRNAMRTQLALEVVNDLDVVFQELRLQIAGDGMARTSSQIDEALCEKVHAKELRDVLRLGYEAKLLRLARRHAELQRMLHENSLLITKPGDTKSERYLADYRERQKAQLHAATVELAQARQRVIEFGGDPDRITAEATMSVAPKTFYSREAALVEFDSLIARRRTAAYLKYGTRPIRFERDAAKLPEAARAEFSERRALAAEGQVVIAVELNGRWWIYEGHAAAPALPAAVAVNFTEADRLQIERRWQNLQAELWTREVAFSTEKTLGETEPMPDLAAPVIEKPALPALPTSAGSAVDVDADMKPKPIFR